MLVALADSPERQCRAVGERDLCRDLSPPTQCGARQEYQMSAHRRKTSALTWGARFVISTDVVDVWLVSLALQ